MLSDEKISLLIKTNYNIDVNKIEKITDGSAQVYVVNHKYVLKYYQSSFDLSKIIKGINISKYLLSLNYNVPIYYKTIDDKYYFNDDNHYAVLMNYLMGDKIEAFCANKEQLIDSAVFYAKFIKDLSNYQSQLPMYEINKYSLLETQNTIDYFYNLINDCNREDIKKDILLRIKLLKQLNLSFFKDLDKITICNCHGDYYVSQCLYKNNKIYGILDFESAKKMPIAIEVIRSYMYLDNEFNLENLIEYVGTFDNYFNLNYYDLKYMPYMYYIKLLKSSFGYEQYINNKKRKDEYLLLGKKLQGQITYLSKNLEIISEELIKIHSGKLFLSNSPGNIKN